MKNPEPRATEVAMLYATFSCFGPSPKTCLAIIPKPSDERFDRVLEDYLRYLDTDIGCVARIDHTCSLEHIVSKYDPSRSLLMHPSETCKSFTVQVATRLIAHRMVAATKEESRRIFYKLFQHLSRQPILPISATWFFEAYAHDWFRSGGEFGADELPVGGTNSQMRFYTDVQTQLNYFTDPRNLAAQVQDELGGGGTHASQIGKYFQPFGKSQESFDGVVFNHTEEVIILRFTMAPTHMTKLLGIEVFLDSMPTAIKTVHIVFVVPEDCARNCPNEQVIQDFATFGWGGKIKQWQLVFPDADIENVVIAGWRRVSRQASRESSASEWGSGGLCGGSEESSTGSSGSSEWRASEWRASEGRASERRASEGIASEEIASEEIASEGMASERSASEGSASEGMAGGASVLEGSSQGQRDHEESVCGEAAHGERTLKRTQGAASGGAGSCGNNALVGASRGGSHERTGCGGGPRGGGGC